MGGDGDGQGLGEPRTQQMHAPASRRLTESSVGKHVYCLRKYVGEFSNT